MRTLACDRCTSNRIRRIKASGLVQRIIRELTPLRRYLCLDCGHRGWAAGHVPWEDPAPLRTPRPARPLEQRDLEEAAQRRFRFAASLVVAILAGAVVALLVSGFFGP
jgi:hypothetical protein